MLKVFNSFALISIFFFAPLRGAEKDDERLLKLDLESFMQLEVTSVSRASEKLFDAASAVHVITEEDIRRSGAQKIPELLRMVPGLQVTRVGNAAWQVGARGFDGVYSNKLLVLVDGRSVYTPVFSGVYWSSTSSSLENIDRIEVIRGPGSALWGSNAVNGVINISTKHASETQGTYIDLSYGTEKKEVFYRHGFSLDDDGRAFMRIYGTFDDYDSLEDGVAWDENRPHDDWHHFEAGFRMDFDLTAEDSFKLSGEFFDQDSQSDSSLGPTRDFKSDGYHVIAEYRKELSDRQFFNVRTYYDHYIKRTPESWTQGLDTYEIDADYHFPLDDRHQVTVGAGLRIYRLKTQRGDLNTFMGFRGNRRTEQNLTGFIQDKVTLIRDELTLTLGSKFESQYSTVQPTARLAWTPTKKQTVWMAYSHATRSPSYFGLDVDFMFFPLFNDFAFKGNEDIDPENLEAFELGYRVRPTDSLLLDSSIFYHRYSDLVAFGSEAPLGAPAIAQNDGNGHVWGFETAVSYRVLETWRLMATYTFTKMDLNLSSQGSLLDTEEPYIFYPENSTAEHKASLRSLWDLTDELKMDVAFYYNGSYDDVRNPTNAGTEPFNFNSYITMDARIAWQANPNLELVLAGYNLLDSSQRQAGSTVEVPTSVLASAILTF